MRTFQVLKMKHHSMPKVFATIAQVWLRMQHMAHVDEPNVIVFLSLPQPNTPTTTSALSGVFVVVVCEALCEEGEVSLNGC